MAKNETVKHGLKFGAAGLATIGKINFKLEIFVLVILQLATGALKLNFPSYTRISEQVGLIKRGLFILKGGDAFFDLRWFSS